MESLFLLVPVALVFIVIAVRVLFWAVNSGQYDDLDTEAHRILFDEDLSEKVSGSGVENNQSKSESADSSANDQ